MSKEEDEAVKAIAKNIADTIDGEIVEEVLAEKALKEGLEDFPRRKHVKIFDVNNIREMETYLFNGAGTPHPAKTIADEDTDASAAHGDRVIALGLCVLALEYQPRAAIERTMAAKRDTLGERMRKRKQERRNRKASRFNY